MIKTEKCGLQTKKKRLLLQHDRCELCGDQRGLEVHHIIPRVCGGSDELDNLIVICRKCHGVLTPKAELTRLGQTSRPLMDIAKFEQMLEEYGSSHLSYEELFAFVDACTI